MYFRIRSASRFDACKIQRDWIEDIGEVWYDRSWLFSQPLRETATRLRWFPGFRCFFSNCESTKQEDLPQGEVGELWISGPSVISGYFQRPQQTAQTLVGSWLRSGDLACQEEDGYYKIAGRAKDLVIGGGMNVIRWKWKLFLDLPEVSQAAIVGIPHPEWGKFVMLLIVKEEITEKNVLSASSVSLLINGRSPIFLLETFPEMRWKGSKRKIQSLLQEEKRTKSMKTFKSK